MALMTSHDIDKGIEFMREFVVHHQCDTGKPGSRGDGCRGRDHPRAWPGPDAIAGLKEENRWRGVQDSARMPDLIRIRPAWQHQQPDGGCALSQSSQLVWGDTQRIQRWTRLMQDREVHTRESFIGAQLDTVSMAARNCCP